MATMTINLNGDYSIGIGNPAAPHWNLLQTADDDTTKVYNNNNYDIPGNGTWQFDFYTLPLTFAHGTISSVSIVYRNKISSAGSAATEVALVMNSGFQSVAPQRANTSWTTNTETWYTNPETGGAWTTDAIAGLKILLGLYAIRYQQSYCTQIYLSITYTPYGTTATTLVDGGACSTSSIPYVNFVNALSNLGGIQRINAISILMAGHAQHGNIKSAFYTNGSYFYGTERTFATSDAQNRFGEVFTTNPATSVAWTQAEVNALQAGVAIRINQSGSWITYCTEVVVIAIYTTDQAPGTCSTPSGASNGSPGTSYGFSTAATDPEGDNVYYVFDWGDTTQSNSGWYASGQTGTAYHSWSVAGTYQVKAYAVDPYGASSASWSGQHQVVINTPPATPSVPSGPSVGSPLTTYGFSTSSTDPDGQQVRYYINWNDGYQDVTGWVNSGQSASPNHFWGAAGSFNVIAMAEDSLGGLSGWSAAHNIVINTDPNAPSTPTGTISGIPNVSYNYSTSATDPDGNNVKYTFEWDDGSPQTTTGWLVSGVTGTLAHVFATHGTFHVKAFTTDTYGATSGWSSTLTVVINATPTTPSAPSGTSLGHPGTSYTYTTSATDPDGAQLRYVFEWDDGTSQTVTGWYASGATASANHTFATFGSYHIKVYAQNANVNSAWSNTLTVDITGSKTYARVVGI